MLPRTQGWDTRVGTCLCFQTAVLRLPSLPSRRRSRSRGRRGEAPGLPGPRAGGWSDLLLATRPGGVGLCCFVGEEAEGPPQDLGAGLWTV